MHTLDIFVISWAGQHENAVAIANTVRQFATRVVIVYSDPRPEAGLQTDCELIKRSNELFWGDKFKACLDACSSDLMLVIHADCSCDDWSTLVKKCLSTMQDNPAIGIWAPLIKWANMSISKSIITTIAASPLAIVAQSDAIVFALAKPVITRMMSANYTNNIYGWGIDDMAAAYCYSHNMLVVIDTSIRLEHPETCGYPQEVAMSQKAEFLKQLTLIEAIQNRLLWSCIRLNYIRHIGKSTRHSG